MKHTFIYKGRLVLNFDNLTSETSHYYKPDGSKAKHPKASKNADGLEFGYMEKPGTGAFWILLLGVIHATRRKKTKKNLKQTTGIKW